MTIVCPSYRLLLLNRLLSARGLLLIKTENDDDVYREVILFWTALHCNHNALPKFFRIPEEAYTLADFFKGRPGDSLKHFLKNPSDTS